MTVLPKIFLDTGEDPGVALYSSGNHSTQLEFVYTVRPEQYAEDLDVIDTESLDLTKGKIYRSSKSSTILVDTTLPVSGAISECRRYCG